MLFNSIEFLLFLPVVFFLYWAIGKKQLNLQNVLLLVSSYVFYGWWDVRFLTLILASTVVDYVVGIGLSSSGNVKARKALLGLSLLLNLGLLGVFKYFDFFSDSLQTALLGLGYEVDLLTLELVLPVGISFYTFQTLSYSIDVYKGKLDATRNFVAFAAYVSFFPQLVAGPIERATNLLPQFLKERQFDYSQAVSGVYQMVWGLFKKIVIADTCAPIVNTIFGDYASQDPITLWIGAVLFAFQIYGDFSGYSDIAIGCARFFGIRLQDNFKYPYFSRDIAEFWRRWHVSLSQWFRDYLYIPLGGSQAGVGRSLINVLIIFLVSGFWHGANWTFTAWGALHALYFVPLFLFGKNRKHRSQVAEGKLFVSLKDLFSILFTFALVVFAWVVFRCESIHEAWDYWKGMLDVSVLAVPRRMYLITFGFIGLMLLVEWLHRDRSFGLDLQKWKMPKLLKLVLVYAVIILTYYQIGEPQEFIYFQF